MFGPLRPTEKRRGTEQKKTLQVWVQNWDRIWDQTKQRGTKIGTGVGPNMGPNKKRCGTTNRAWDQNWDQTHLVTFYVIIALCGGHLGLRGGPKRDPFLFWSHNSVPHFFLVPNSVHGSSPQLGPTLLFLVQRLWSTVWSMDSCRSQVRVAYDGDERVHERDANSCWSERYEHRRQIRDGPSYNNLRGTRGVNIPSKQISLLSRT